MGTARPRAVRGAAAGGCGTRRTRDSGRGGRCRASRPAVLVQAVNGLGLVSLDDNLGAYYRLAGAAQTATALTFVSPPGKRNVRGQPDRHCRTHRDRRRRRDRRQDGDDRDRRLGRGRHDRSRRSRHDQGASLDGAGQSSARRLVRRRRRVSALLRRRADRDRQGARRACRPSPSFRSSPGAAPPGSSQS